MPKAGRLRAARFPLTGLTWRCSWNAFRRVVKDPSEVRRPATVSRTVHPNSPTGDIRVQGGQLDEGDVQIAGCTCHGGTPRSST